MKATHTVIKTIRAESLEHERYCQLLRLCREGTPRELLACIQNSHNGKSILNTIYWIQDFLDDYLETTPLANACIGGNEENVRLLLIHGAIPDIEDRVDGLFVKPACIFAIGKPNLLKLFFPAAPWWKGECSDVGCQSLNQLDGDGGTLVPHPDPNYIIWCVMRGARVESPKRLYKACFRSLPPLMQEFVIRCGVRKEKLENFRKWLTMRKATPELLEILRRAEDIPEELQWRPKMEKLLLSAGLFPKEKFFSLLDSIFPPHDLISVLKDCRRNYDASNDKQFLADTMELIFSAILYQCRRW